MKDKVKAALDEANFDVPMVPTKEEASGGGPQSRAFLSVIPGSDDWDPALLKKAPRDLITLDAITDNVYARLNSGTPNLNRQDVYSAVVQIYNDAMRETAEKIWQWNISFQMTPQYFFWSNQPLSSRFQDGYQLALGGLNWRAHRPGGAGFELSLQGQLSGSSFNFSDPDWFQNALAVYQAAYVAPLGPEFRFAGAPGVWSYLQGSIFTQLAAGLGNAGGSGLHLGFLWQETVGGQIALNIGSLQIVVNDQIVYSWLFQPKSQVLSTFGNQWGFGIGGQW